MPEPFTAFSEEELAVLHVPEYAFALFLACLAGKVAAGQQLFTPRPCACEEDEAATFV